MANITIAIDCMGGDYGPSVTIPAVKNVLASYSSASTDLIKFQLFGHEEQIRSQLSLCKNSSLINIEIFPTDDDVLMTDKPSVALKKKKNSSMRLMLESVRDGRAHACVSSGNTGALMAISRFILKMLPGIDRPAIISALPTHQNKQVYLLDLGANVECDEKRLAQFAIMGNELCKSVDKVDFPRVSLLNVGEEDIKGTEKLKRAAAIINDLPGMNYQGFIEGNKIFSGEYDVIVTDGFTGNSVLKASEGLSHFLLAKLKLAFQKNWWTRFIGLLARPIFSIVKEQVNPERYNGACLIGLRGIVIKSHGSANVNATVWAIKEAIKQVKTKVPVRIRDSLEAATNALENNNS